MLARLSVIAIIAFHFAGHALADEMPKVIYFGGHASSPEQMANWTSAAQEHVEFGKKFVFGAIAYPANTTYTASAAISAGRSVIERVAKEINDNPNRQYIIAGHSSGAALANSVAARVKNPSNVKLIALDGFRPSDDLQKRMATACWSSKGNGMFSLNYNTMKAGCRNFHDINPTDCATRMCLHFKLVNKNASRGLGGDYRLRGYTNVEPNLAWLKFSF